MSRTILFGIIIIGLGLSYTGSAGGSYPENPYLQLSNSISQDTIPLQDRQGDFINDNTYNPFDIKPSLIKQEVEYDPETGNYILFERIGDEYYRAPTYMTFEEYINYREEQQKQEQFSRMAGISTPSQRRLIGDVNDPVERIDIQNSIVDRLFGGTDVTIEPKGSIELTFGVDYQRTQNPFIPPRLQSQGGFDFDMDIQMNVEGNIGEKMNLDFNYDTNASFDFDNKIKIDYDSEQFSEDDIIKKVEAGDVSLPLNSNLIQGPQSLFGVKTVMQFGRLTLTGVASQQRSERKDVQIEDGALIQEFEIRPDEYDENRHFFISHYHRNQYENALSNLPQIKSLVRITNIEVWVTTEQNSTLRSSTTVAAITDLGESELENYANPNSIFPPLSSPPPSLRDINQNILPENGNSDLFGDLVRDDVTRTIVNTTTNLSSQYGMTEVRDFKVQSMRRLSSSEFTYHPELGYISLNQRLRPAQVLGVSYEYTYSLNGNKIYKVGEITNETSSGGTRPNPNTGIEEAKPEDVIYIKMLKSSNQVVDEPSWDLMMKNVYSLNTSQLSQEDFKFDIFFEDNEDVSLKRFLPEEGFREIPLLDFFKLDRLNSYGDPQQDGIFDFEPGLTVNTRTGSIFFPVLEPFGQSLLELLDNNDLLYEKYGYPELYTTSVTNARENLDKNRFIMMGKVKSSVSSEIPLGSFNIPQGSVTVRAGSQILREGIDYDIDYGIGRVKIINDAYLQQGVPIRVSFEDQALFSLQQKTMFGLRADYQASKKLNIGATYMRLFERPYTEKVNLGSDPINNRVFGLDMNYSTESPFVTKMVDKLPFINTKETSTINFSAEVAALKPGHSKAINVSGEDEGVVSLDDFEGASSSIPLGSRPNLWSLASTPFRFDEQRNANDRSYGYNRASFNWYIIDDRTIRNDADRVDSYTRTVDQSELFQRELPISQIPDLLTFDLVFNPTDRGPYNFDPPEGSAFSAGLNFDDVEQKAKLKDPESRWGGIMRYLPNNDFQASNFEYIEFWMLNPFMEDRDGNSQPFDEDGSLYFNLGDVSEDILKDNLQYYENSVRTPEETTPEQLTAWGNIPLSVPQVNAFDLQFRREQDLGLDGLEDDGERDIFSDYVQKITSTFPGDISVESDPSNDNFLSYRDESIDRGINLLDRYRQYNNPQGNAPEQTSRIGTGNPLPDSEDLNDNRSLEQSEAYYEYEVKLKNNNGEIQRNNSDYITDVVEIPNPSNSEVEKWYRFQIPIQDTTKAVNGIQGFRSIQFIRMYMTGFKAAKVLRMAEFELVRNQWRRFQPDCDLPPDAVVNTEFIVDEIGIEENGNKLPFGYVSPKGIKQERVFSTFSNVLQDENALNLKACQLPDSCDASVYKLTQLDMRYYKRLQMFSHAEIDAANSDEFEDGDLSAFIRLGKDFNNNYYEYEIPLVFSDTTEVRAGLEQWSEVVWRKENNFDIDLEMLTELKKLRNKEAEGNFSTEFARSLSEMVPVGDSTAQNGIIKIKGNPSLGYVKGITIGLRHNQQGKLFCGEVWVNELRMKGLDENGGVAGEARLEVKLADFGDVTASAAFSTIGWGSLEERVFDRSIENITEYDMAANLNLGKLLPYKWNVTVPFYAQYAKSRIEDQYDPYELDLTVDELLAETTDEQEREDIIDRSAATTTIRTYNFTNVRKERAQGSDKKPMPWDISNFTASYGHTRTEYKDEFIKEEVSDDYRGGLDYNYTRQGKPIEPFKKIKSKHLRILKEFNFNPFPNSFGFSTQLRRFINVREYRIPDSRVKGNPIYIFNDQRFDWDRRYNLRWDFTKALKFDFNANNFSVIDEIRPGGIKINQQDNFVDTRDYFDKFGNRVDDINSLNPLERAAAARNLRSENLRSGGRNKNYDHQFTLSYTLPIRYLPYMDWINVKAQYDADYAWTAGSLSVNNEIPLGTFGDNGKEGIELGNIIHNNQSRSLNATFDFEKLYDNSKYIKSLDKTNTRRSGRNSRQEEPPEEPKTGEEETGRRKKERNGERTGIEKLLLRPLFSLRNLRFTYRENLSTMIPGFRPINKFMGLSNGFDAPGWAFVAGLQPDLDSYLLEASQKEWITLDKFQNQQVLQNSQQNFEASLEIEPWKDFKIDVDFKKSFTDNFSEYFINGDTTNYTSPNFMHTTRRHIGSFDVTYFAMQTLFNNDLDGLFRIFQNNRISIADRLARLPRDGETSPSVDWKNQGLTHENDGEQYPQGFGKQQTDVLIHAFLSAYTGVDLSDPANADREVTLNITDRVSKRNYIPAPNWTVRWNGLSKIGGFRDIFSSFTLTHGYKSNLKVSQYASDLQYQSSIEEFNTRFHIPADQSQANYFSRYEIPSVVISEQFVPIIGVDFKTRNDITFNYEYKKTRNLTLLTGNISQLTEARNTEHTLGFGWIMEDVEIGFLTGGRSKRRNRNTPPVGDEPLDGEQAPPARVTDSRGRELAINFDLTFRDDITLIHELDKGSNGEPTRGLKTLQMSPSVEYEMNENLSLRAFIDYSQTQPYTSNSYPITSVQGGITAIFNLN